MNTLLIFFALPIATIILAAVLEKLLNCPIAVSAVFFAIFLVVTFSSFDATFLIATIIYTILAFISALLVRFIIRLREESNEESGKICNCGCSQNNLQTIANQNNNWNCGCRRR